MTSFTCIHTNGVYQQYKGNICNRAFKCGSELPEYVALILRNGGSQSPDRWLRELRNNQQELSEAEEMELFKKEFYEDLSKITNHRTVSNAAVNISGEAFKAMKDDPQYREKVLSLIQRDWGDSYAPRNCSVLITVGATLNEYRADSWPVGYDSEFDMRSQNSFYKRTSEKKDRQKELLEEYLENRAQAKKQQLEMLNKKIAKMELERSRQTQSWNSERQMAKASNAYDANIMMEAELVKNITKTMEISNNQSYYINPNTRQFTSNVKNTAIKDRKVFNGSMQNLLNPIEDLV